MIRDYDSVPQLINATTRQCVVQTAREFIAADTWVLAGVSRGDKEDIVTLNDKLARLFETR